MFYPIRLSFVSLLQAMLLLSPIASFAPAQSNRAKQLYFGVVRKAAYKYTQTHTLSSSSLSPSSSLPRLTKMSATVNFSNELTPSSETTDIHFIGRKSILESLIKSDSSVLKPLQSSNSGSIMEAMIGRLSGGPSGDSSSTFVPLDIETDSNDAEDKFVNLNFVSIPEKVSRHNHHMSPHVISALVSKVTPKSGKVKIFVAGSSSGDTTPIAAAIARSFPLYDSKTGDNDKDDKKDLSIDVCFLDESFAALSEDSECKYLASAEAVAKGVRLAAKFGDMPPAELTTDAYADECKRIAEELGESVTYEEIIGEELNKLQYGGIYGVGKAAECPPRLITMTYTPPEFSESIALCGKGVVYDTGGLSLKPKTGMGGMKHDMGGSAGLLGGFCAAVELKVPTKITLLLGIVENAIGPLAVRNDDILKMHSGKTVEINNTDAEGRLVLGDCVSHASKNLENIDLIIDMATLTGAQLVATGKKHAGILANTEEAEKRAYDAGMRSGDLVYPLLYAPELLKHEFASKVADMKNSVKDRGNAQTSCAGHFIESHIDSSFEGGWVHVDMAGPSTNGERATGYGVGLVLAMVNAPELS